MTFWKSVEVVSWTWRISYLGAWGMTHLIGRLGTVCKILGRTSEFDMIVNE
jgi:hypothetical protein